MKKSDMIALRVTCGVLGVALLIVMLMYR